MKKALYSLVMFTFLLTVGCSAGNIDVSKIEITEPTSYQPENTPDDIQPDNAAANGDGETDNTTETDSTPEIPYSEVPETAELGERVCDIQLVDGGHFYLTINKCEVFDSLNDAGYKYEDSFKYLLSPQFNLDPDTTELLKGFKMVKMYMTVENVDAITCRDIVDESYGDYDFSLDSLGGIPGGSEEYFSLDPEDPDDDSSFVKFHLEPGEKKNIIIGSLIDTRQVPLEEATFVTGHEEFYLNTPFTKINLNLDGDS